MGWQPIKTAPKDGTSILVCGGTFCHDNDGSWTADEWPINTPTVAHWSKANGGAWWLGYGHSYNDEMWGKPTYWMPLPEPPND